MAGATRHLRPHASRRGQGNTEFIVIGALVAIAAIGIITLFGDNIRGLFGNSSDALGGDTSISNSGKKSSGSITNKNMKNFGQQSGAYEPQAMGMMRSMSSRSAGAAAAAAGSASGPAFSAKPAAAAAGK